MSDGPAVVGFRPGVPPQFRQPPLEVPRASVQSAMGCLGPALAPTPWRLASACGRETRDRNKPRSARRYPKPVRSCVRAIRSQAFASIS
jgi:hypothetical protein